jgi:hypothetical protein
MSIEAMTWVFSHSEATTGDRLVLLALADHANEAWQAYPGVKLMGSKARLSKRQVQRCLKSLRDAGRIRACGQSPFDTVVYELVRDCEQDRIDRAAREEREARERGGDKSSPRDISDAEGVTNPTRSAAEMSSEPSVEPKREPSEAEESRAGEALFDVEPAEAAAGQAVDAEVLAILRRVKRVPGSKAPTIEAVEKVRDAFPDRDAVRVAEELEFWSTHGNGSRRQIKSIMQTYRSFMRQSGPASASRSPGNPVTSSTDNSWDAGLITE